LRIVALRALGLGDLLTAVPCLRGIARAFPRAQRVLLTPRVFEPIVHLLDDPWQVVDRSGLEGPLPRALREPDLAVNLHGRGPESHELLVALGPRRLVAFRQEGVDGPRWRRREHEVARWCRLLSDSGIDADRRELDLAPPPWPPPAAAVGAVLIHPGAASPARRWPPQRFAAVARRAAERGSPVAITGSPEEAALAGAVGRVAGLGRESLLAGVTDVADLAAAVAHAACVVCGDTGVAHLATAFGTPSVVLFGPTPPAEWGPPRDRPIHRAIWRGARGDPHGQTPAPGLLDIEVPEVLAALDEVAASHPRDRIGAGPLAVRPCRG
jgi:ADP-heptose:LPS heptosyltransferase